MEGFIGDFEGQRSDTNFGSGHFDENADDSGQSGGRGGTEKRDRNGDCQFKEVAGSDERPRRSDIVADLKSLHERVGESRVEIHLDHDRNG